ncbi:MAG: NAD(P)H-hydrate epimerase [Planctomycetaceae bacterium]
MFGYDPFLLSCQIARSLDAAAVSELGIPSLLLMENAARGVTDLIQQQFSTAQQIVIACGPGNNGGDGLAIVRQLAANEIAAQVFLIRAGKTLTPDAAANLRMATAAGLHVTVQDESDEVISCVRTLTASDLIVDCLLGTGVSGAVREPFAGIIASINESDAAVLAVDVPSGLNCDTGTAAGECIRADRTVTFVGPKEGFLNPAAAAFTGIVSVAHIGLPTEWVRRWRTRR